MITKNINPFKKLLIVLCFVSGTCKMEASYYNNFSKLYTIKLDVTDIQSVNSKTQQIITIKKDGGYNFSNVLDEFWKIVDVSKKNKSRIYFSKTKNGSDRVNTNGFIAAQFNDLEPTVYAKLGKQVSNESKSDEPDDPNNNDNININNNNNNDLDSGNDNSNDDNSNNNDNDNSNGDDDGDDINTDNNKKDNLDDPNKQDGDLDDVEEKGFWSRNKWYIIALSSTVVSIGVIGTIIYQKNKDDKKKRKK